MLSRKSWRDKLKTKSAHSQKLGYNGLVTLYNPEPNMVDVVNPNFKL